MLCAALVAACSSDRSPVVSTEINLDIVHPSDSGDLGFTIDRVDYRITCTGNPPGSFPIPPADTTGTDVDFDDSVDISGAFEVVDTRVPPLWMATMDLPPGLCTLTMLVFEAEEVVCIGSETLTIVEDETAKFDIVLVCSLSVDLPSGALDAQVDIEFVIGNLCPQLFSFMAIPGTVDINTIPPRTRLEYRSLDPDGTCGANCEPEICTTDSPPVCSPSVYNADDPRCDPEFGGDPSNPACQDGSASGLVCTLYATSTATGAAGGNFISPVDGVTPVGPSLAINLDELGFAGTGVAAPGADVLYECDPALPGSITMDVICGDGDPLCNRAEAMTVTCPGQNYCESNPVDCSAPSDCTADGVCDPLCDPLGTCERCPGQGDVLAAGSACASTGNVCDGAGACVECLDADNAGTPITNPNCDSAPVDCLEPSVCSGNVCQPRGASPAGTPCFNGECDGTGDDGDGGGAADCQFVAIDPPAATQSLTLGCTDSSSADTSILSFDLTVDPSPVVSASAVTADLDGVAELSEPFLDTVQDTVSGGVSKVALIDLQATVRLRSGGTGADVALVSEPIATTCAADGAACDPANDAASVPGARANTDCLPQSASNPCSRFVPIPTSTDCTEGGVCDSLGKLDTQCALNGFCVTDALSLPLQASSGSYTADTSGEMRFGWDDASTGATVAGDGTWSLPAVAFSDPVGPNGLRVNAGGLAVGFECTMGVPSDDPTHGVGVPDQSSPTPDALLIEFPIQVP